MQKHIIKEEIEAYRKFMSLDFSGLSEDEMELLLEQTKSRTHSWESLTDTIIDELDALKKLRDYKAEGIEESLFSKWKQEAETEYTNRFKEQLEHLCSKVNKHRNIQITRSEIDPVKKLLIEMEEIIGSECYNSNIQNYGSWGELESVGRSFRYPVKFSKEERDFEYKTWRVDFDTPSEELITGYYAFGANELSIFRALHKILKHLEKNYGFKLPKQNK